MSEQDRFEESDGPKIADSVDKFLRSKQPSKPVVQAARAESSSTQTIEFEQHRFPTPVEYFTDRLRFLEREIEQRESEEASKNQGLMQRIFKQVPDPLLVDRRQQRSRMQSVVDDLQSGSTKSAESELIHGIEINKRKLVNVSYTESAEQENIREINLDEAEKRIGVLHYINPDTARNYRSEFHKIEIKQYQPHPVGEDPKGAPYRFVDPHED